jgi:hypothetical protein
MADNLPPSSANVTESGSLNLPEPSGSPYTCNVIILPLNMFQFSHVTFYLYFTAEIYIYYVNLPRLLHN